MAETTVQEAGPNLPVTEGNGHAKATEPQVSSAAPLATPTTLPMEPFGFLVAAVILKAFWLACYARAIFWEPDEWEALRNWLLSFAAETAWFVFHYQVWSMIPRPYANTTPVRAVGLIFIPVFNFWWVFRSFVGLQRSLNAYTRSLGLPTCANSASAAIFSIFYIATAIFGFLDGKEFDISEHPVADLVVFLVLIAPSFVCWLLMVLNQRKVAIMLLTRNPAMAERSRWAKAIATWWQEVCEEDRKEREKKAEENDGTPATAETQALEKAQPWWRKALTASLGGMGLLAVLFLMMGILGGFYVLLGCQIPDDRFRYQLALLWIVGCVLHGTYKGWNTTKVIVMLFGFPVVMLVSDVLMLSVNGVFEHLFGVSPRHVPFNFWTRAYPYPLQLRPPEP